MVNRHLIAEFGITEKEIQAETKKIMGDYSSDSLGKLYEESIKEFQTNTIIKGKVLNIIGNDVIVDIGYKSEGLIQISEFPEPASIKIGDEIEVFLEGVEDDSGLIGISKSKADRIRGWERIISTCKE
ncbi:MAG: S1 RNA-binding domain-containing protein, partial [Planctomycetes bacterium]|nr:S1 RNA-binding domain-containing protein [Planctomycetota bacterium]